MFAQPCLADGQLLPLLDESLSRTDLTTVIEHLDNCRICQHRLEELAGRLPVTDPTRWESTRVDGEDVLGQLIRGLQADPLGAGRLPQASSQNEHWRAALEPPGEPQNIGKIADYELTEIIGSGGMGIVLRGRDEVLERDVAIKFPHVRFTRASQARTRFLNEARSAAALEHENVVRVYQVGLQNEEPYLVMELVDGETLQDVLNRGEPISNDELRSIAIQAAKGLDAAHQRELVHGDVKPANLLINRQTRQVKLTDFGLARVIRDGQNEVNRTLAGTPEYMSPEQAMGRPTNASSDLYSLGAVLYALATGAPPVSGSDLDDLLNRIEHEPIERACKRNPNLDRNLGRTIDQLLEKQAADRPDSAAEVVTVLSQNGMLRRHKILVAILSSITMIACFLVAEATGWIDVMAGVGPIELQAPSHPFVIVSREIAYGTLQEAIENAIDGDVIEVRSPGPHAVRPLKIQDKALTIRGLDGRPAIVPFQDETSDTEPLISTNSELKLESLEISFLSTTIESASEKWDHCALHSIGAPIHISKCRIRISKGSAAIGVESTQCLIDETEIYGSSGIGILWRPADGSILTLQNSVMATRVGLYIDALHGLQNAKGEMRIVGSTFRVEDQFYMMLDPLLKPNQDLLESRSAIWRLVATDNIFDARYFFSIGSRRRAARENRRQRLPWLINRLFDVNGQKNLIARDMVLAVAGNSSRSALIPSNQSSTPWSETWIGSQNVFEFGTIRFKGPADSQQIQDHQLQAFEPAEGNAD